MMSCQQQPDNSYYMRTSSNATESPNSLKTSKHKLATDPPMFGSNVDFDYKSVGEKLY